MRTPSAGQKLSRPLLYVAAMPGQRLRAASTTTELFAHFKIRCIFRGKKMLHSKQCSMGTVPSTEGAAGGKPTGHGVSPGAGVDPRLKYADDVAQAQFEERLVTVPVMTMHNL